MQISKMMEEGELEEAHLQVLALRQEFQRERLGGVGPPTELAKKEKDLSLLYGDLRDKVKAVVRDAHPPRGDRLVPVVRIIQEEERRGGEPGGLPGSWMAAWREAVGEGAAARVGGVQLEGKARLAPYLGLMGRAVAEDLDWARRRLRGAYPPSFGALAAYEDGYRRAIGRRLEELEGEAVELKDLYLLLDWILHQYRRSVHALRQQEVAVNPTFPQGARCRPTVARGEIWEIPPNPMANAHPRFPSSRIPCDRISFLILSEKILGSPPPPPNELENELLEKLKEKYCCRVKVGPLL